MQVRQKVNLYFDGAPLVDRRAACVVPKYLGGLNALSKLYEPIRNAMHEQLAELEQTELTCINKQHLLSLLALSRCKQAHTLQA